MAKGKELFEARRRNVSNKVHLVEYMKTAMYLQDTIKRAWKAWRKSDARRHKEYQEVQTKLPRVTRKTPQEEEFLLDPYKLNMVAYSLDLLPEARAT